MDQQTSPVYTFPYSISWAGGKGELASWGMAVSHAEPAQWAKADGMGPKDAGQWAFFGAPVGIQSVILSASELVQTSSANRSRTPGLTTDNIEWGSVKANLFAPGWVTPTISFPLVQGSAFVTGEYHWAKPLIQSSIRFRKVTFAGALPGNTTYKYKAVLRNNQEWLIYITPLSPTYEVNRFDLDATGSSINGPSGFNGFIQVAKVPRNEGLGGLSRRQDPSVSTSEAIYDVSAGVYPTGVNITGDVSGTTGSYTLSWVKNGTQGIELLMFALPHHVASMTSPNRDAFTTLQLSTTTKGLATAIKGDSWTMTESDLPISMEFAPWRPGQDDIKDKLLNKEVVVKAMQTAGAFELKQNIGAQTNVSSAYFDGKALAKFAAVCYALHQLANDTLLALSGLQPLQQAFADHIDNKQTWPLVYDDSWGGVVSSAAYATGNPLEDFGNTYYNDHHFHYGYFVYAAAVIGFLDPTWLTSRNVDWVNMLVRDFAGSDVDDPYFPFSRSFDWYHGHSWAAGLFDSSDGKNQESSSEDTMASYAIKMWGQVSGDQHMEARGNLMLAIQKRSLASYYLYQDDNTVQPSAFIGNKAAGILFENKIDHTTYFGAVPEYIQGIHMIPILPFSTYIRTPELVTQEWAAYFSNLTSTSDGDVNYIDTINSGWRGILMANYAMCNQTAAKDSYQFFANSTFNKTFLDGGASQTWYLAWSAAFADEELSSAE
jgi:endo-1,3(4)-beta-glucanase